MAVYSTNQNRHFYIAKRFADGTTVPQVGSATSQAGDIQVKCINDGLDKEFYFVYQGADTVLRSDRIPLRNLNYIKAIPAWDMLTVLKKVTVTLNGNVNGGEPVAGEDYVLRIAFRQFYGMSDQDVYFKDAVVHVGPEITNPTGNVTINGSSVARTPKIAFFEAMVKALNLSFSREIGATKEENPYLSFTFDAGAMYIWEKDQTKFWHLGTETYEKVNFEVYPTIIFDRNGSGEEVIWGEAKETERPLYVIDNNSQSDTYGEKIPNSAISVGYNAVGNGTKIADMEFFYAGERGDQYRYKCWPNVIETELLAEADKQYNVLEIHYAFTDTGVNSYRSEKDITIAVPMGGSGSKNTVINDLIGAINTATGLSVATLANE